MPAYSLCYEKTKTGLLCQHTVSVMKKTTTGLLCLVMHTVIQHENDCNRSRVVQVSKTRVDGTGKKGYAGYGTNSKHWFTTSL